MSITAYLLVWIVSCLMFLPEKTCPTGWEMFSDVCYFLSGTSGNWDEARRDCRDKGADLVVIDSSKEQVQCMYIAINVFIHFMCFC